MTTTTLPTPTVTTPRTWRQEDRGRNRNVDYVLSTETTEDGRTVSQVVRLAIGHSKGRKAFYAVAHKMKVTTDPASPFTTEGYAPFDGVHLASEPVARFSAKALDAFTAKVIAGFVAALPTSERLQSLVDTPYEGS